MKTNIENMNYVYYARNNMFVLNSILTGFIYIWNEIKMKYIVQFSLVKMSDFLILALELYTSTGIGFQWLIPGSSWTYNPYSEPTSPCSNSLMLHMWAWTQYLQCSRQHYNIDAIWS